MIEIRSYISSLMINCFDKSIVIILCVMSSYTVNETFGDIMYGIGTIFICYITYGVWPKIMHEPNWYKNCWYNKGK